MRGDLNQLRVLIAVAEGGSFTSAAAERNIEVSAVSRSVRELEDEVGVRLFERLARGVRLTEAGRSYVASARDLLERHGRARVDARLAATGRSHHLAIGFPWSATSTPVVELLRSFAADFPSVAIDMVEAGNDELIARVRSGRLDLAIALTDPMPLRRLKEVVPLSTLPLWLETLAAVLPAGVAAASITWRELADSRLLCRTIDDWPRFVRHIERLGGPTLAFEPHAVSLEGVFGLVTAGLGWTLAPVSLAHLLPPSVRAVPISSPGAELQVEALWREENVNPALSRFLALCRQLYRLPT